MGGLCLQLTSFQDQSGVSSGPYSREVLAGSFALTQSKMAVMPSLVAAVPLGLSRGIVAPSLAVQVALRYGRSPKHVLCSRAGSEPHRALYCVGRLPPVGPPVAL